jgi:hypothetical protein
MDSSNKLTCEEKEKISNEVGWRLQCIDYPDSIDNIDINDNVHLVRLIRNIPAPSNPNEVTIIKYILSILRERGWYDSNR